MEFLNPEDKQARTKRLFLGYFLIAVLIGLATLILVYLAQGYGYDPNKGLTQNGLVFVDSKPSTATIFIDNESKAKTDARISVNDGTHSITLKKDKYRDWNKSFNIQGGSIVYFSYPRLFPVDIPVGITQVYDTAPAWVSQSPDRHWLVMQKKATDPQLTMLDMQKPTDPATSLTIPTTQLVKVNGQVGTLSAIEWSDDNRHLMLLQTTPDNQRYYVLLDREDTTLSFNVTTKLSIPTANIIISLRDKKFDKYYLHDVSTGALSTADVKSGVQAVPLITGVVAFKSYADNLIMYVTYDGAEANQAKVFVLSNQTDKYLFQNVSRDPANRYLLDIAKYENKWYYVTSSTTNNRVLIYQDPLSKLKPGNTVAAAPRLGLVLVNAQYVSFSDNTRFISMQSGKKFVIFDAELNRIYRFDSALTIADTQQAEWMDGYHMTVVTDAKTQVFDFDGTNVQTLTASRPGFVPYFDREYTTITNFISQADGRTGLQNGQLIVN